MYSFSKISTFKNCKYQFKLRYIDKIPEPKNTALVKGNKIHKALETLDTSKLEPELKQIANNFINSELGQNIFNKVSVNETRILLDSKAEPSSVYKESEFVGYIDKIIINNNHVELIDFKTGKYKDLIYQDFTQLILYALYVLQKYPLEFVRLRFVYVEHLKENVLDFNKNSVNVYKTKLLNDIQEIENCKEYVKNPTRLCDWCGFKNICKPFEGLS